MKPRTVLAVDDAGIVLVVIGPVDRQSTEALRRRVQGLLRVVHAHVTIDLNAATCPPAETDALRGRTADTEAAGVALRVLAPSAVRLLTAWPPATCTTDGL